MHQIVFRIYLILFLLSLVSSCMTSGKAPVISKEARPVQQKTKQPSSNAISKTSQKNTSARSSQRIDSSIKNRGYHIVDSGDTLYSIAWRYGYDFRDLSSWNSIAPPYTIYPGQVIRFKPDPNQQVSTLQPGPVVERSPQRQTAKTTRKKDTKVTEPKTKNTNTKSTASTEIPKTKLKNGPVKWSWPTKGKIIRSNSPTSKKGVDIAGRLGQDVVAAAVGNVVYSGSGLLGYGQLIIIKHNEKYLSAYAHNSEILVKEGDVVSAGQLIAKMGQTSQGRSLLHFEIRKDGKPVNPQKYLPKI